MKRTLQALSLSVSQEGAKTRAIYGLEEEEE
jgi:hypothetical protein